MQVVAAQASGLTSLLGISAIYSSTIAFENEQIRFEGKVDLMMLKAQKEIIFERMRKE